MSETRVCVFRYQQSITMKSCFKTYIYFLFGCFTEFYLIRLDNIYVAFLKYIAF